MRTYTFFVCSLQPLTRDCCRLQLGDVLAWGTKMRTLLLAICALLFVAEASAQVSVYVETTAEDSVGKRLDFVLRDKLRASRSFELTYDEDASVIKVALITLDPDEDVKGSAGTRTIYSFNILLKNKSGFDYFYTSFVGYCGADILAKCSENISQEIGVAVEEIRAAILKAASRKSSF